MVRIIGGRYRLAEQLGGGGMGSVWRAEHLHLHTEVAIKLMGPETAEHPEGLARFSREARAAASLVSPHIVRVFDFGVDDGTAYIAMELLQGESLTSRISRLGRLRLGEAAGILAQVARAVGKAHEAGIVHRDLKPDNVFLARDDEGEIAKVLDFGVAKHTEGLGVAAAAQTRTGMVLGTPHYMSPEQVAGEKEVDHRTDIWSFGVIAFECLTGRQMFQKETLGGLVLAICVEPLPVVPEAVGLPKALDAWFARCLARDREIRFQSIREAAQALVSLAEAADSDVPTASSRRLPHDAARPTTSEPPVRAVNTPAPPDAPSDTLQPAGRSRSAAPVPGASKYSVLRSIAIALGLTVAGATLGFALWPGHRSSVSAGAIESAPAAVSSSATASARSTAVTGAVAEPEVTPRDAVGRATTRVGRETRPVRSGAARAVAANGSREAVTHGGGAAAVESAASTSQVDKELGTISMNSIPVSNVLVDGRPVGSTPVQWKTTPGVHTVTFVHPERGRQTMVVDVKPGQTSLAAMRFR